MFFSFSQARVVLIFSINKERDVIMHIKYPFALNKSIVFFEFSLTSYFCFNPDLLNSFFKLSYSNRPYLLTISSLFLNIWFFVTNQSLYQTQI
jgi:hypothetical protein